MEINANAPVNGLGTVVKSDAVKPEAKDVPDQQTVKDEGSPDYRLNLSKSNKPAVPEPAATALPANAAGLADLGETEADSLSRNVASELAQTTSAIANQGIQKAIDLFT